MEQLIVDAVLLLRSKKKRPSMESIFNEVKCQDESKTIEVFKDTFDDCLERKVIMKRGNKDSYFVTGCDEDRENEEDDIDDIVCEVSNIQTQFTNFVLFFLISLYSHVFIFFFCSIRYL